MKSVLISIQPKWVEKIASGQKTIEVRKTAPKCKEPFKCYIYATEAKKWFHSGIIVTSNELLWLSNGKIKMCDGLELWADGEDYQCVNGKIIGEFVCDWITKITPHCDIDGFVNQYIHGYPAILGDNDCLSFNDMKAYLGNKKGYDWHISDLKIYDEPKKLSEFYRTCSYSGICYSCNRFRPNGTPNDKPNDFCDSTITRAPQSWQYVKELEE